MIDSTVVTAIRTYMREFGFFFLRRIAVAVSSAYCSQNRSQPSAPETELTVCFSAPDGSLQGRLVSELSSERQK